MIWLLHFVTLYSFIYFPWFFFEQRPLSKNECYANLLQNPIWIFFFKILIFSLDPPMKEKKNQKWSIAWWVVFIRKSERHMKRKEVKEKCFIRKLKISKNVPIFSIFFFVGRLFVLLICKSAYIFLTHGCFLFASTEVEQILFS